MPYNKGMRLPRVPLWLSAAAILVIIFSTIYTVVQQAQRSDANYPQIQLAEDTAAALNGGARPASLVNGRVNLADSLAPFVVIYTRSSQVVAGSGYLEDHIPCPPLGVLKAAQGKDYSAVTWQPRPGVRLAAVTVSANNYYVVSGRSLKQVETNENQTFILAFSGGLLSLAVTYLTQFSGGLAARPKPKRP